MTGKPSIKRYKLSTFKLNVLLEVTNAINESRSAELLLEKYKTILKEDLIIGKILIYKYQDSWKCILKTGIDDFDDSKIVPERDLVSIQNITYNAQIKNDFLKYFDIIIPIINSNNPLAYVLIGDIDEEGEGVSPTIKHLNFIHTLSNIIMVATENIRLFDESLQQESIKKEFELASKMQNMLIPENSILPKNKYIYVTAYYHPHFSVGGDYYDVLELGKNEIGFCIADVSGKGMSAAILMSNFQANLRALFTYEISLFALVEKLNVRVNHNAKGEKFITLFIGRYNFRTRELEYINAGHNPPVLYETKSKKIEYLTYGCVGMGMMDELPNVNKGLIHIKEHSKLLCYTDGLVELAQHKHIEYDTQEIEHCISNDSGIAENIQWLIEKQKINNNNTQFFDDISILGIEMF